MGCASSWKNPSGGLSCQTGCVQRSIIRQLNLTIYLRYPSYNRFHKYVRNSITVLNVTFAYKIKTRLLWRNCFNSTIDSNLLFLFKISCLTWYINTCFKTLFHRMFVFSFPRYDASRYVVCKLKHSTFVLNNG